MPGGRIVANQEIGARGQRGCSLNRDIRIRAGKAHAELRFLSLEDGGINGESNGHSPRLDDIANRGISLAGVGEEEYGKRALGIGCEGGKTCSQK